MDDVKKELVSLMESLVRRMRLDLMSSIDDADDVEPADEEGLARLRTATSFEWIAHPKTLRLTTRPRLPLNPDGTRERNFARISKSCNMPSIIYGKSQTVEFLAEKITQETLIPLFRKLHPEQCGWNLSLINICATNMALVATDHKDGPGRDIGRMFKTQKSRLKDWQVEDVDIAPSDGDSELEWTLESENNTSTMTGRRLEEFIEGSQADCINGFVLGRITKKEKGGCLDDDDDDWWDSDENESEMGEGEVCRVCGALMPAFAKKAHERFHNLSD